MDLPRLSKTVRRITILNTADSGELVPVVIYNKKRKKKKVAKMFRPMERAVRQVADASADGASAYLSRHKKSNRKRRNGWLRDWAVNTAEAGRKSVKALDPTKALDL